METRDQIICAFCGRPGVMTGEHVLGDWLRKSGMDQSPAQHGIGWLNRIGRDLGTRPPFRQKVRDVCGECNSGWMSQLETAMQRVLTPRILGQPGQIHAHDLPVVATWVQKTALTGMLVSSDGERAAGYGLPTAEYRALYAVRREQHPLPASRFWIGRYQGARSGSVRVTPLVVGIDGLPEPDEPQGYAMTIVLGELALHGVRFTTPSLEVSVSAGLGFDQLWPNSRDVSWPSGTVLNDADYLAFAGGRMFRSHEKHIELRPWKPATELDPSEAAGSMVRLPTICGEHVVYYPAMLVRDAMRGQFYAFMTACECPKAYVIHTETDGAHCKAAGEAPAMERLYEETPGDERLIENGGGSFFCKLLPTSTAFD